MPKQKSNYTPVAPMWARLTFKFSYQKLNFFTQVNTILKLIYVYKASFKKKKIHIDDITWLSGFIHAFSCSVAHPLSHSLLNGIYG